MSDDRPFAVHESASRVTIAFAPHVDDPVDPAAELLDGIVRTHSEIAFDFSANTHVASRWLKRVAMLSREATDQGKAVGVIGLSKTARKTADIIGVIEAYSLYESMSDWERAIAESP